MTKVKLDALKGQNRKAQGAALGTVPIRVSSVCPEGARQSLCHPFRVGASGLFRFPRAALLVLFYTSLPIWDELFA